MPLMDESFEAGQFDDAAQHADDPIPVTFLVVGSAAVVLRPHALEVPYA
jgi:hypothetical protein